MTASAECPNCQGNGYFHDEHQGISECALCGGVGRIYAIEIPPIDFAPSGLTGKTFTQEHDEWDALRSAARKQQ